MHGPSADLFVSDKHYDEGLMEPTNSRSVIHRGSLPSYGPWAFLTCRTFVRTKLSTFRTPPPPPQNSGLTPPLAPRSLPDLMRGASHPHYPVSILLAVRSASLSDMDRGAAPVWILRAIRGGGGSMSFSARGESEQS